MIIGAAINPQSVPIISLGCSLIKFFNSVKSLLIIGTENINLLWVSPINK